eukprot:1195335-Prorocentrum_minimum.AAC.2
MVLSVNGLCVAVVAPEQTLQATVRSLSTVLKPWRLVSGPIMDKYTNAVISFLEKHQAVGNVKFTPQEPCSSSDIYSWESRNSPYKYAQHTRASCVIV